MRLKSVRSALVDDKLARSTVNGAIGRVRRLFRWGASEELIPGAVWQALASVQGLQRGRTAAYEPEPVGPVADDVVAATLPFLASVVRAMVELQKLTGARPGEIVIMRPVDVDTTGEVWRYTPATHKTEHRGQSRVIFIGPKGQAILRPFLNRKPGEYCFSPQEAEHERRALATAKRLTPAGRGNVVGSNRTLRPRREPGERSNVDSYRRAIWRAAETAKVSRWSPNQLRHAAATSIRATAGLEAAAAVLVGQRQVLTELRAFTGILEV